MTPEQLQYIETLLDAEISNARADLMALISRHSVDELSTAEPYYMMVQLDFGVGGLNPLLIQRGSGNTADTPVAN